MLEVEVSRRHTVELTGKELLDINRALKHGGMGSVKVWQEFNKAFGPHGPEHYLSHHEGEKFRVSFTYHELACAVTSLSKSPLRNRLHTERERARALCETSRQPTKVGTVPSEEAATESASAQLLSD